jgi:FG-GAP-like repeat/FG-GAP repeat
MKSFQVIFPLLFITSTVFDSQALVADILTSRGNLARTGLNQNETTLSPSNVSSRYFGLLYNNSVDGQVYAQPLYVTGQKIITSTSQTRIADILYIATENDSLYAFDADTGALYWKSSLLPTGESPVQSSDPNIDDPDLVPEFGITATPVIDRSAGANGTIFVVAFSTNGNGGYFDRLHAIDLSTGKDRTGIGPVIISASTPPNTRPANTFNPTKQLGRAGLLLLNGIIYTTWASYGDNPPYTGWIIGYHESDLKQAAVLNTDPNGSPTSSWNPDGSGNGIWQAGNGPSVDANNNIYVSTGNGPFDETLNGGFPANQDYGDSVLKLTTGLSVADYFTPFDQQTLATQDIDLGSGGPMVLNIVDSRGIAHHLLTAAGKDSNLYLLDRDNLGKFHSSNQIYQELDGVFPGGVWSSPAYFNGSIYLGGGPLGGAAGPLLQLQFDFTNPNKPLLKSTPVSSTETQFGYPGATPTISSNGTTNGIVWAYERNANGQAILHAYDATNLQTELFNSGSIGSAVKFAVPTVCNGKVFVGTSSSVAAFGLTTPSGSGVAKDFNNDGNADLVWENTSTGQRTLWFLKNGTFQSSTTLPSPAPSWHIAGVGDFLGKGQSDLVLENTNTGAHVIWIFDGGVYAFSILLPTVASGWHIVGAGDFDGDGQADLVWENTSGGQRVIWLLRNGIYQSYLLLPTVPPAWHIAGVGDFLGNGQSDLVLENTATGQHTIWLLQNGVLQKALPLPAGSIYWHIAGVADFDGDGQADLVWENTSGGQRIIWLLKNGIYQGNYLVLPTASTQWHIVDH